MSIAPEADSSGGNSEDAPVVTADLFCVHCGYNLRTLAISGICPECASSVRESIISGPEVDWARRARRGLTWLIAATAGSTVLMIPSMLYYAIPPSAFVRLYSCANPLYLLLRCLLVVAAFRVTRASPYLPKPAVMHPLRLATRWLLLTSLAGRLVVMIPAWSSGYLQLTTEQRFAIHALATLLELTGLICLVVYLRQMTSDRQPGIVPWSTAIVVMLAVLLVWNEGMLIRGYRDYQLQRAARRPTTPAMTMKVLGLLTSMAYVLLWMTMTLFFHKCRRILGAVIATRRAEPVTS
ncbi:MAG: hypothetical protein HY718_13005 [Planctomycetes bacterium]|nr:hypothetical protein [Planctomycetota bacterium]